MSIKVEVLECLLHNYICVQGPGQIIGDVNAQELEAACCEHHWPSIENQQVSQILFVEVNEKFLGCVDFEREVVQHHSTKCSISLLYTNSSPKILPITSANF